MDKTNLWFIMQLVVRLNSELKIQTVQTKRESGFTHYENFWSDLTNLFVTVVVTSVRARGAF